RKGNCARATVSGSDRALDQGRTPEKFAYLRDAGIALFPQDGSGLSDQTDALVASAAVEDTVPDVAAASRVGAKRLTRAELLSSLFNDASVSIGIAGTSGKSTTTAILAWLLHDAGRAPTVMNGAVMKNFAGADAAFASALVGDRDLFVSELDESDGSIALFNPTIAVLHNISHDHKSMDELRALFGGYCRRAQRVAINLDDEETRDIAGTLSAATTYGVETPDADYTAINLQALPTGVSFTLVETASGASATVRLAAPGRHNVSNAIAAVAAATRAGVEFVEAAASLETFAGVRRRFDVIGDAGGVTVIDDFGHNPDKIAATLETLHEFPGRLLVMFQPHGFGPLKTLKREFIDVFVEHLAAEDRLFMPEPVYFGGTVDRAVGSEDIAAGVRGGGRNALALADRAACGEAILDEARNGDRIIVMGARDDSLTTFAQGLLETLRERG
ncbi:MAG: Mur ligase family protein, partial [Pseudomonadota bacterium]